MPENVKIEPFINELPSLMKVTDLMITRAGASTMSEILSLNLPAIFIPSPYVANNHQYYNAMEIKNNGGGEVIAFGSPEEVAKVKGSYTGLYLNKILNE